ncbi:ubiquitin carboxyl-terminal hydrolase-domain-containing protein [Halteromyces radiatus]|uniref:ubiquitin carboxyl-terminal hydrolase-domain-containing protein n=1 Tax=Halteromyces radiatus TaxID=101107 RepID=UPI00221FAC47|nr:ubiquitin carboxyl-terminal hydrolase-domain-containing protein [Halteromyces radiatus]KAI8092976.1 ubiquitin carboxyl-terminal hydrolase-domain-containing protein [Halteromyces radiatus]
MGSFAPPAHFYQVQTSSYITSMDISSSGQTLVFGDGNSFVHQYADRENYMTNPYSLPVTTPDTTPPPNVIVNNDTPLSAIGMPYYSEPLLSAWTSGAVYDVGYPTPPIDDEILKGIKTIDFVGYAPNPGNIHRNQVPRRKKQTLKKDIPKFRSEQERELLSATAILDETSDLMHSGRRSSSVGDILLDPQGLVMPKHYHHVEIQYSKFGVDDFDFGYYNRTIYGGLETNIRNSYCNSLLQVLYFILPLRQIAKCHIGASCEKENCLLCELGFLFRMLEDSKGQNCQATNFLKAFSTIPQAAALGLFEPESPTRNVSYSMLMQNFVRFILEQLHQEANTPSNNPLILKTLTKSATSEEETTKEEKGSTQSMITTKALDESTRSSKSKAEIPSTMQQLFGLQTLTQSKCGSCNNEMSRITYPFVVDLLYPKKSSTTKKTIQGLPSVLLINSGASTSEEASIWRQNGPSSPKGRTDSPTQDNDSPSDNSSSSWLPERFGIRINGSELTIKALPQGKDVPTEFIGSPDTCAIYELSSTILQVQAEEEVSHLVAQIKITGLEEEEKAKSPWYVFNDFLVKRIRPEEITSFKGTWKTPAVIQYTRVDIDNLLDLSTVPSEIDYSLLFKKMSISENTSETLSYEILTKDEMPTPGTLIAIDSEFVALRQEETEIRSDGTKSLIRPSTLSLARLSVTRGEDGEKEGVPFIDDYIVTSEPVVDYLTEFSGIEAADLDPTRSKRTLVPLKVAYKKIRLLVDLGCVFIGHGLKKDFRIINILVPPEQIVDTVDIYHIRNRHRKISLRFLAWHLLDQEIQSEGHDSIVDAKTALVLYKKYLEYRDKGTFGQVLEGIYAAGHKSNWLKGPKDTPSSSSTVPSTPQIEQHTYFSPGWSL